MAGPAGGERGVGVSAAPLASTTGDGPVVHVLFQKRVPGDDALLRLARMRLEQAGLAAEVYAGSAAELEGVLHFAPQQPELPTVHLSRGLHLLDADDRSEVLTLIQRFGSRVAGFVVHDQADMPGRLPEVTAAAAELSRALAASGSARLYLEYAAGVDVEAFAEVGSALAPAERVGVCVDVGHIAVQEATRHFALACPHVGRELSRLDVADPRLPGLADDVVAATTAGRAAVAEVVAAVAEQGNPVHYHLHDGHPLFPGLSDHRGFLRTMPVPFDYAGRRSLPMLFGVAGLAEVLDQAARAHPPQLRSLTLEIHRGFGRLQLDAEAAAHFGHWERLGGAERTHAWLALLLENAELVRALWPGGAQSHGAG